MIVHFLKYLALPLLMMAALFLQCKKEAGPGGSATITGKVYALDYSTFPDTVIPLGFVFEDKYYIAGKQVYLRYGDEPGVGQSVRTSYDGTYRFENLRPGTYKILVYSRSIDTLSDINLFGDIPMVREVAVDKRKETVRLEDFIIIE